MSGFDSQTEFQSDETLGKPLTRIVQQTNTNVSAFTKSSYIRLGGYIANDEQVLLPPDTKVTSSEVAVTNYDSSQAYQDAAFLSAEGSGSVTAAQIQGNTQSQNMRKAKAEPTDRPPLQDGILMFSDHDLQINTLGAAYMEFQDGHSTYIKDGDSAYTVNKGQFVVNASNGITIKAGVAKVESKDDMQKLANQRAVAEGTATYTSYPTGKYQYNRGGERTEIYATKQDDVNINYTGKSDTVEVPADITIIASNNISQKAYGPLDETTYGDSYKNVHGNSVDIFYGTSKKETHGTANEYYYSDKHTWIIDSDVTGKLAASLSMFLGISTTLNLSASVSLGLSGKADIIIGADAKVVVGASMKVVVGQDTSAIGSGFKFVAVDDAKIVLGIDIKRVNIDAKSAAFKLELCDTVDLKKAAIGSDDAALKTKVEGLSSKLGDVDSRVVALTTLI